MKDRRKKASRGVIIFSSLLILIGTISFLSIIIVFFMLRLELQFRDYMPILFSQVPHATLNFTVFWLTTIINLLIMLCWVVSGIGTLLLKEWSRQLLLVSIGIYFINKAIDIFISIAIVNEYAKQVPILPLCLGVIFVLVFSISLSYFFTHPSVVRQFKADYKTFH